MKAGKVEVLVILSGNPVYDAPVDAEFAEALAKVPFRVHLSLYDDETSELCDWHIAETHFLESWSDTRAFDGTASIVQPLIAPLYNGRSAHEILAAVLNQTGTPAYDIVREHWKKELAGDFETAWRKALHDGLISGTAFAPIRLNAQSFNPPPAAVQPGIEIVFRPDPTVWDGRFANNGWLQELPKPLTKLTWDNCAQLSPAMAEKLGVANEDVIEIERLGKKALLPVWIAPGHADECITLGLGYGRRRGGESAKGAGFAVTELRFAGLPWSAADAHVKKTGDTYPLASTQVHESMEGRDIVRVGTIDRFRENPKLFAEQFAHEGEAAKPAVDLAAADSTFISPTLPRGEHAWGMAIDLGACTGCSACVVACQAENNIPVVGKDQVRLRPRDALAAHRSLRDGDDRKNPTGRHPADAVPALRERAVRVRLPGRRDDAQPEGLNEMTYNRCVGTRFCSNNCPYKVRRFNWFDYADCTTVPERAAVQPGRHRARARRDGEVHVLRPADPPRGDQRRAARTGRSATARSSPRASRRARRTRSCSATSPIRSACARRRRPSRALRACSRTLGTGRARVSRRGFATRTPSSRRERRTADRVRCARARVSRPGDSAR